MANSPLHVIILAAGKGTRMKSDLPKVLHKVAGKTMIGQVLGAVRLLEPTSVTTVLAPNALEIQSEIQEHLSDCQIATQSEQLGTGHAVATAMKKLGGAEGNVLVVYADTPLITSKTLKHMVADKQKDHATIALAGIHLDDPTGYGRLVMPSQPYVERIVECKDATAEQKLIPWVWAGMMAFSAEFLRDGLEKMTPSPATGEYYLTELVEMAASEGETTVMVPIDADEAMGVNDRVQLAEAEAAMQQRLREHFMREGVTMTAPETVHFSMDTQLGRDVVIHPHVVFGPGVHMAEGVEIRSFSHIERATIGKDCVIGPYARLRPGTELADEVRVGNFVELKKSYLGKGSKVNHLSYVGDSEVGANVNIGAGTITCNYDGVNKYNTTIKDGAFIGSNVALVAPINIGKEALIGAGSVITEDVPDDALAFERSAQIIKPNRKKKEPA